MSTDLNEDLIDNNYKWTNISDKPKYLVGREALTIFESNQYILRKPIKYGFFNFEYPFQGVVDDITKIIEYCLINVLQINKKSFGNYGIVLLIPDLFIKQQVKALVNIFLKTFQFKSIFIHLESVMSSFGAALQSSCVIDIGAEKINVCCIDEGIIIEDSLIRKNIGGDDLTKLLNSILKRKNSKNYFPYEQLNIYENPYYFRIIEKLKESECEFPNLQNPTSLFIPKNCKVWQHRKGQSTKMFNLTLTDAAYLTPLAFLNVELFSNVRNVKIPNISYFNDIYNDMYHDPEDIYEDLIQSLGTTSENAAKKEESNTNFLNASATKNKSFNYNNQQIEEMSEDNDDYYHNNKSKEDGNNESELFQEEHNSKILLVF